MANTVRCTGQDWKNKGREEIYIFPDSWTVSEYKLKNTVKIDDGAVRGIISGRFKYKGRDVSITELAAGKRDAVILADDLSRFTPAYAMIPIIIEQLSAAGIKKDNIRFIIATGSHMKLTREEMALKLGEDIVREYTAENHDCINDEMGYLGDNSYGTPIKVNKKAADAGLVIGIGSLNKHRFAYGSGGAKIILPGISHIDTIRHNHKTQMTAFSDPNDKYGKLRNGMNEAGRMFSERTDLIVINVALNRDREITDVFIGDCVDVFTQNADKVLKGYMADIRRKGPGRYKKADIGVFRVDTLDPLQIGKAVQNWQSACRIPVVTGDFGRHIYQGSAYGTYEEYMARYEKTAACNVMTLQEAVRSRGILIYSDNLDQKSAFMWNHEYYVTDKWDKLINALYDAFGKKASVAFFHDAYFQTIAPRVFLGSIKNRFLRKVINKGISAVKRIRRIRDRLSKKTAVTEIRE